MTLSEVKNHLSQEGTQIFLNELAGWQFVKRAEGAMFKFENGKYKTYRTLEGLAKAALYRIKRG